VIAVTDLLQMAQAKFGLLFLEQGFISQLLSDEEGVPRSG
jgi:hypothetical protein